MKKDTGRAALTPIIGKPIGGQYLLLYLLKILKWSM